MNAGWGWCSLWVPSQVNPGWCQHLTGAFWNWRHGSTWVFLHTSIYLSSYKDRAGSAGSSATAFTLLLSRSRVSGPISAISIFFLQKLISNIISINLLTTGNIGLQKTAVSSAEHPLPASKHVSCVNQRYFPNRATFCTELVDLFLFRNWFKPINWSCDSCEFKM